MPKRRGVRAYIMDGSFALADVQAERRRQDDKWGPQNHDQMIWLGILAEEFGEAAKEINELHFRRCKAKDCDGGCLNGTTSKVRSELIQVAAVAVAMIESLDRNGR